MSRPALAARNALMARLVAGWWASSHKRIR
jgi:hypothetical protein